MVSFFMLASTPNEHSFIWVFSPKQIRSQRQLTNIFVFLSKDVQLPADLLLACCLLYPNLLVILFLGSFQIKNEEVS